MNPVAKAIWFIESHFAEDISLDDIAAAAGVSRFHMSRAFGLATGRPMMRYVRGRRLTIAAQALAAGAPDILSVALDAGYGSHEAFTRAFREQFGQTPESLRAAGCLHLPQAVEPVTMTDAPSSNVPPPRIECGKAMLIAGLMQHFAFDALGGLPFLWQRARPLLGTIPGQVGNVAYGACYNTDDAGFDYIAGAEVASETGLPPDLATLRLTPQRYAVFTHAEHVSTVRGTFMAIFNEWLPRLGFQSADAAVFERYDERFDSRTGTGGFELWIPIRR
jgi:AraC family transcriptional regulator